MQFCKIKTEAQLHLFCECGNICVIWNDVIEWTPSNVRKPSSFRRKKIFFGAVGENIQAKLVNCILY